jgi:hypothetical protein
MLKHLSTDLLLSASLNLPVLAEENGLNVLQDQNNYRDILRLVNHLKTLISCRYFLW